MPITAKELGHRLRTAREACRMTQEEVADQLGVSRSTVAQMELGNRPVSGLELDRMAYLFGRDIHEFIADSFQEDDTLAVLFRSEPSVSESPQIVEKIRECIALGRELTSIEQLLGIDREQSTVASYPMPQPKTRWEAIQQGARVADEERKRLGLGLAPAPEMTEVLELQGVRTGMVDLPEDVSGLSLNDPRLGFFVVVNRRHHIRRRRFSFAHEYGHLLMDRDRFGTVSSSARKDDHLEVRANSFAAAFLMPDDAVSRFVAGIGKGKASRTLVQVYDENEAIKAEGRAEPHSQDIQIYDVVQLASMFGVSVAAVLYRLRNLRLLSEAEHERLKQEDDDGRTRVVERLLGLPGRSHADAHNEFRHRLIGLALDAFRRELISAGKLRELAKMVEAPTEELEAIISGGEDDAASRPGDQR